MIIVAIFLKPIVQRGGEDCTHCGEMKDGTKKCPPSKCNRYKIVQKQTEPNDWGNGNTIYLDRHRVDCGKDGLNQFKLRRSGNDKLYYKYKCLDGVDAPNNINKNTDANDWGNGNLIYLDRHNIDCRGKPLAKFRLTRPSNGKIRYDFECNNLKTAGQCRNIDTGWNQEDKSSIYLDRHNVKCDPNEVITRFKLKRNGKGKFRYDYQCCKM